MNVQRHDPGILPPHWDQKLYDRKPRIGQLFCVCKDCDRDDWLQGTSPPTTCWRLLLAVFELSEKL